MGSIFNSEKLTFHHVNKLNQSLGAWLSISLGDCRQTRGYYRMRFQEGRLFGNGGISNFGSLTMFFTIFSIIYFDVNCPQTIQIKRFNLRPKPPQFEILKYINFGGQVYPHTHALYIQVKLGIKVKGYDKIYVYICMCISSIS